MAKILVNYMYNASTDRYSIMQTDGLVLATEKVSILDTEENVREPLVVLINGNPCIFDRESYESVNKKFSFIVKEDGHLEEVKEGKYNFQQWLPKDTDVSKLILLNGQLLMVEEEEKKKEPEQEQKVEEKKTKKK